jgi:general L-amino acid transport system permease protein
VGRGPIEAARSLGLRKTHILFFITMPLAMRVIVPPLTSQYLRLVKNTSLAVVIGFPEVVQIFAGSVLNQSGQAIEVMGITMLIYLTISLCISLFMNWYNRRVVLVER